MPSFYQFSLDAWLAATTMLARTDRIRALVAVRPSQCSPSQAAKMTHTLQSLFPGRIELNVTSGAWDEDAWIGNFDSSEVRYKRVREWLEIVQGLWYDDVPFSYEGEIYRVEGAELLPDLRAHIPLFFSGGSEPARRIAFDHADTYLLFGAPLEDVRAQVADLRAMAPPGRQLRFGMRVNVLVREDEEEAWQAADALIARADPKILKLVAERTRASTPTRQAQYELTTRASLIVGPNLWAGVGKVRFGVTTTIVGDPAQVAQRLLEFREAGVDMFILGGFPLLSEAQRFGELVGPRLR